MIKVAVNATLKLALTDPGVLAALVPWQVPLEALASAVIGFTNVVLNNDCFLGECNLGNLITDAMVDSVSNAI